MKIEIKDGEYNRYIGDYNPKANTFTKKVSLSKHLFRKLDAWGMDGDYFTNVLVPSNTLIRIWEEDEKKWYEIKAKAFAKKGEYYHFNKAEDHRAQIFLPRRFWTIFEPKVETEEERSERLVKESIGM